MSTFLGLLLNQKKKEENRSLNNREIWYLSIILTWQNQHYVDLGMVLNIKKIKKYTLLKRF